MEDGLRQLLDLAQGPLLRFAIALLLLGLARNAILAASDVAAARLTMPDRRAFRRLLGQRVLWQLAPTLVLDAARPGASLLWRVYHVGLSGVSLLFRVGAVVIPAFMAAHAYLWERGLGVAWPALPTGLADALSIVTLAAGGVVLLGRLYSPLLRSIEPAWSFFKPLILLAPLGTGLLARNPTWSPVDYHVVLLLHVCSAAAVFVLIPFARLLAFLHVRIEAVLPEMAWPSAGVAWASGPCESDPKAVRTGQRPMLPSEAPR